MLLSTDVVLVLRRLKLHIVTFGHHGPPTWLLFFGCCGRGQLRLGATAKLIAQESLSFLPKSLSAISRCCLDDLMNRLSAFPRKITLTSHQSLLSQLA